MGKKAVVLSGGGAKGGYQIGAWKALRRLGFFPDIVTGTSVGALNGALMALNKFEDALNIWQNMSMDSVFEKFVNVSDEENPEHSNRIITLAKDALLNGGADYTPLQDLVKGLMDENALRNSRVKFGLVTTTFPKIKPVQMFIEDIPEGKAADFVLASAAAFPFLKSYKIGEDVFVDGGYSDNMPIQMAIDAGAEDIVVVNISKNLGSKLKNADNVKIRYVSSKKPLNDTFGGMLMFDKDSSLKNMMQGEIDTYKAFDLLDGYFYSFEAGEKYKTSSYERQFNQIYNSIFSSFPNVSIFERNGRESVLDYFRSFECGPFSFNCNILYCAEAAGKIFDINERKVYLFDKFNKLILDSCIEIVTKEYAAQMTELSKRLDEGTKLSAAKLLLENLDKKFLLACCLKTMLKPSLDANDKRRLWLIAAIKSEIFCSSLFCYATIKKEEELKTNMKGTFLNENSNS